MTDTAQERGRSATAGVVLHGAARYDLLVWLALLGRERAFRNRILAVAHLHAGEAVLDVGCGTGTLAIAAKRQVGPAGTVYGIDPSPEMTARANKKANQAGVEVVFGNGMAQGLPFRDGQFDVVLATLMLHHLPGKARHQCVREMRRVLKPKGRVVAVDFASSARPRTGFFRHWHRHGHVDVGQVTGLLTEGGFTIVDSGLLGMKNFHFVLAAAE
jgi:ubiquinone/menaquinone biosynthesis C-methylase UbiE